MLRIAILFLAIASCINIKRYALGNEREFVIFYSDELDDTKDTLIEMLAKIYYTPQPESLFLFTPVRPDSFRYFKRYKNIIIVATSGSQTFQEYDRLFHGGEGFGVRRRVFSEDDMVIGIYAESKETLHRLLSMVKENLYDTMLSRIYELYRRREFYVGRDKNKEKAILERLGIEIRIPKGWLYLEGTEDDDSILVMVKHNPDRFFFVYKSTYKYPLLVNDILELRDRIVKAYYGNDYPTMEFLKIDESRYQGRERLCITSVWQNDEELAGGPFRTCAYYDGEYFLIYDIGVFAPEKFDKLQYLLRTETILLDMKIVD